MQAQQSTTSVPAVKRKPLRFKDKDKEMSRFRHGYLLSLLIMHLGSFVEERQLGWIVDDPDVRLPNREAKVRPDIAFISNANEAIIKGIIEGAPDLVVESISASSYEEDTEKKFNLYAEAGIKEYWIVSAELRTVHVFTLDENGQYQLLCSAVQQGKVFSKVIDGFELDIARLFHRMK